ncbi:hypothetical protein KCMC57_up34580 [Kitasatospora sp. CMC57]|uniref:Bacterial bifunctional deaminase-reductase C-terminal domain-containing protein n=1 Tax=Kitasatospora sp. CMC57 TaxID=3231513 RepID=A0AB33JVH4_9ACTN
MYLNACGDGWSGYHGCGGSGSSRSTPWPNSGPLDGDLTSAVKREARDVVVMGSLDIVRQLMTEDLVAEYRLMTFPTILGAGQRLFPADGPHRDLECVSAEQVGALVLTRYGRAAAR